MEAPSMHVNLLKPNHSHSILHVSKNKEFGYQPMNDWNDHTGLLGGVGM